jgi:hypothetical protein
VATRTKPRGGIGARLGREVGPHGHRHGATWRPRRLGGGVLISLDMGPRGGTRARLSSEASPMRPQAWGHVSTREPASARRRVLSFHRHEVTWQHGNPPPQGGRSESLLLYPLTSQRQLAGYIRVPSSRVPRYRHFPRHDRC